MNSSSPLSGNAPPIGLIGLGLVGNALGERLIGGGHRVSGHDINAESCAAFRDCGGLVARDAGEVFATSDTVLLSLPGDAEVRDVLTGADGALRAGLTIIDTSTGDSEAAMRVGQQLAERQIHYLDATISGSSEQVRRGEALWMVGGSKEAFDQCQDLFLLAGKRAIHTGSCGSGAKMKLVTNLVLGLNRAALAEGLAFAAALGLEAEQTLEVMRASMAYSRIMDTKGEKMIHGDFQAQARLSQHLKDVRLMLEAAARAGQRLPLSETHRELLEFAESMGLGQLDNSAILRAIEAQTAPPALTDAVRTVHMPQ